MFGTVGDGTAILTANGLPVRVWPNGAWLAWLPLPPDSNPVVRLEARTATDSTFLDVPLRRAPRFVPPTAPVWIDTTSFSPSGRVWWPTDEYLPISLRASAGAEVRLRLPDGRVVPLAPEIGPGEVPWGIRAFDRDTGNLATPAATRRYVGAVRGIALGEGLGPILTRQAPPAAPDSAAAQPAGSAEGTAERPSGRTTGSSIVEAILGPDTVRAEWRLQVALLDTLPVVVELDDDTAGTGRTDSLTVGRPRPGATYHWFLPTGTRAIATGRLGDDLRLRLSRGQEAWIPAADAHPLPAGTPALRATVLSLTATPAADRVVLRVPLTLRVPFRVEEAPGRLTLRLYHAVSDINWTRLGTTDAYLRDIRWLQETSDEVTVSIDLAGPLWGYRTRWSRNDLLLEIRRPPAIDRGHPLRGRFIVVDPGHPPLGATGPTGLREAEANLSVARELERLLLASGARVLLTREGDHPLDLNARVRLADSVGAELLVSVHNNALPDGVNPFTNSGTSVFYNHPRSLPLAQAIQTELVRQLGIRDLGAGRGDLAMVRPTWMPSVLTEGLFMMVPDHEAALRQPAGQALYARAVRDGILQFLKRVAAGRGTDVP